MKIIEFFASYCEYDSTTQFKAKNTHAGSDTYTKELQLDSRVEKKSRTHRSILNENAISQDNRKSLEKKLQKVD